VLRWPGRANGAGFVDCDRVGFHVVSMWRGCGITIRPSRRRFAARLNSGVRRGKAAQDQRAIRLLLRPTRMLQCLRRLRTTPPLSSPSGLSPRRALAASQRVVCCDVWAALIASARALLALALAAPTCCAVASPNNSFKPTPLRGAA
jgi:hypothetical protein